MFVCYFKETRSVAMNIFRKKIGDFSLVRNYLRPSINSRQLIFNINAVVLTDIIC